MAEAAIKAIRRSGARNKVLVPGTAFSTASTWVSSGNAAAMASFHDPANNFAFEVHQYLDRNSSGTNGTCVAGAGSKRLKAFEQWLREQPDAPKGFLGEIAGATAPFRGKATAYRN